MAKSSSSTMEFEEEEKPKSGKKSKNKKNKKSSSVKISSVNSENSNRVLLSDMSSVSSSSSDESLHLLQEIYEQNKKIKRRLTWMVVSSYLKLLFVIVPLILGALYLPALIDQMMGEYSSLLGNPGSLQSMFDVFTNLTSGESPVQLRDVLKNIPEDQLEKILQQVK